MKVTQLRTPMINILEEKYIELYIKERQGGWRDEIAFVKTRLAFQQYIIDYMVSNPSEIGIISTAYDQIKICNKSLRQKALISFDLSTCDEEVRAKYMPLLV